MAKLQDLATDMLVTDVDIAKRGSEIISRPSLDSAKEYYHYLLCAKTAQFEFFSICIVKLSMIVSM